jgi:hypothetical protein
MGGGVQGAIAAGAPLLQKSGMPLKARLSGQGLPFCRHVGNGLPLMKYKQHFLAIKNQQALFIFLILLNYPFRNLGIKVDGSWHVVCLGEFASPCGHVPPKH